MTTSATARTTKNRPTSTRTAAPIRRSTRRGSLLISFDRTAQAGDGLGEQFGPAVGGRVAGQQGGQPDGEGAGAQLPLGVHRAVGVEERRSGGAAEGGERDR